MKEMIEISEHGIYIGNTIDINISGCVGGLVCDRCGTRSLDDKSLSFELVPTERAFMANHSLELAALIGGKLFDCICTKCLTQTDRNKLEKFNEARAKP